MTGSGLHFETRTLAPDVTLHLHSTRKHKTNRLSFFWVADLQDDVTERALLPALLGRGTRSHPTMRAVSQHLEELYGATLVPEVMKVGERHAIALRFDFANDHYLPAQESILRESLDFFREVISEPALENETFPAEAFEQEAENHRRFIESLLNDKGSYALQRCIQEMCCDENYRRYEHGRVADLEVLTSADLTRQWRRNLRQAPTHIYFAGDVETEEIATALSPLAALRNGHPAALRELVPLRGAGEVKEVEERLDVQQTKLVLGYRTRTRFGDAELEALVIANGILGLFPHSKLFLNVREKASLCYYASSTLERTHGLLFITSGIDYANKDQALALIQEQVKDLQEGKIGDDELASTQAAFDNRLLMVEDRPGAIMDIDLTWRLAGVEYDHQQYRRKLGAVTKEQVAAAARRLELDTVYLLCPRKSES